MLVTYSLLTRSSNISIASSKQINKFDVPIVCDEGQRPKEGHRTLYIKSVIEYVRHGKIISVVSTLSMKSWESGGTSALIPKIHLPLAHLGLSRRFAACWILDFSFLAVTDATFSPASSALLT